MNKCVAILRSGLNKNNPCNRIIKDDSYCGIHKKLNPINITIETKQNVPVETKQNIQINIDQLNNSFNELNLNLNLDINTNNTNSDINTNNTNSDINTNNTNSDINTNNTNSDNINSINTNHEIYIVQLSEHIRCRDSIYKVGMTTRGIKQRIKGYPKNTQILFSIPVKNANLCEREVMKQCRSINGITNCNRNHPDKIKQLGN